MTTRRSTNMAAEAGLDRIVARKSVLVDRGVGRERQESRLDARDVSAQRKSRLTLTEMRVAAGAFGRRG